MNRAVVIEKKLDTGHVTSKMGDREYTIVVSQIAAYQHPMNQSSNRLVASGRSCRGILDLIQRKCELSLQYPGSNTERM